MRGCQLLVALFEYFLVPQLAPLMWVFLSISVFVLLFLFVSCTWWLQKSVLSFRGGEALRGSIIKHWKW